MTVHKQGQSEHPEGSVAVDSAINDELADIIQEEWLFKIQRIPENVVARFGILKITLFFLQTLLIISNNIHFLGLWESFARTSTSYRDEFNAVVLEKTGFDFDKIARYHLWRGWVVPSVLAGSGYIVTSILYLRHELYRWNFELWEHYFDTGRSSRFSKRIPESWLDAFFHILDEKHRTYKSNKTQGDREHIALKDSKEFLKVVKTVSFNILISVFAILVLWLCLLQTKIETRHIHYLPRSYVPAVQAIVWYLINDLFYYYPHRIAHSTPALKPAVYKYLPQGLATYLHNFCKDSHRMHHRSKANLGIAAWYCSPWEQIIFNLFPALLGPLLTQILADFTGQEHIWGTHLGTLYVWLTAAAVGSVMAHTGYRSVWNDPGKHDLHHERAFDPKAAVNFGTLGFFDWIHGTLSDVSEEDTKAWRSQRDRQAALYKASRRSGVELTEEQKSVVQQPDHAGNKSE